MKNSGFTVSRDSLGNEGVDLAGNGCDSAAKRQKSRHYNPSRNVDARNSMNFELSDFGRRYKNCLSDLQEAVKEGTLDLVQQAIAEAKKKRTLNDLDESGLSGLHHAVRYNRVEAIAELLKQGAQVNIKSRDEASTPLHISARFGWYDATKLLLDHGANPNAQSVNGSSPLHLACRRNNKSLIALLLAVQSINVNICDNTSMIPLHVAGIQGDKELCMMLIAKGADYTVKGIDEMTPLHAAVANGNRAAANAILEKVLAKTANDITAIAQERDIESNTILHHAALTNNLEIAEKILQYKASVNFTTTNFATPLHMAAGKGHLEMVRLLVSKGAHVNAKAFDGRTALHKVAMFGHVEVINLLIDQGAKVDARDYDNKSPFLVAVASGQTKSALLLLSQGAKINAYDTQVKNCLHLAIENDNLDTVEALLELEGISGNLCSPDIQERVPLHYAAVCYNIKVLQVVLTKQTRFAFQDENQRTPIYLAAEAGRADHVEALGRAGSSLNERDDEGRSPFHCAAAKGHRKVSLKLIKMGAEINCRDHTRSTPLMCAAKSGGLKMCQVLLDNNAGIDDVNNAGDTALIEAVRYNHVSVVELLLDRGASVTIRNNENFGIIDTAVKWRSPDVAMAICQHERWSEIIDQKSDTSGNFPMKLIIAQFPDAAKLIMDRCVQPAEHMSPSHPNFSVTYDFHLLDPGPDDPAFDKGNRYFGPLTMVEHNRPDLLLHPLTQKLLDIKWSSLGKGLYLFSFLFYVTFIISYTVFLVSEREQADFRPLSDTTNISQMYKKGAAGAVLPYFITIFAVMQMLKEIFQMIVQRRVYFTQITNALEWALYTTVVVFMVPYVAEIKWINKNFASFTNPVVLWITGVISIFLCYVNLILFLRRFATLGLYITMHLEVTKTIVKVMAVFVIFILGFAVVFFILFKEQAAYRTLGHAFVRVTIMMMGEMDYTSTFVDTVGESNSTTNGPLNPLPVVAYIFIFIFVFIVGIALMNLLVGLAVGDIGNIQRQATLQRQAMQVEFVAQIEDKYPRCITRMVYKPVIVVKPNEKSLIRRIRNFLAPSKHWDLFADVASNVQANDKEKVFTAKLNKTKQRVKTLMRVIEAQNRLLKGIAMKIDPDLVAMESDDLIIPEVMDDYEAGSPNGVNFDFLDGQNTDNQEETSNNVNVAL